VLPRHPAQQRAEIGLQALLQGHGPAQAGVEEPLRDVGDALLVGDQPGETHRGRDGGGCTSPEGFLAGAFDGIAHSTELALLRRADCPVHRPRRKPDRKARQSRPHAENRQQRHDDAVLHQEDGGGPDGPHQQPEERQAHAVLDEDHELVGGQQADAARSRR
jgi:hypothetical protein